MASKLAPDSADAIFDIAAWVSRDSKGSGVRHIGKLQCQNRTQKGGQFRERHGCNLPGGIEIEAEIVVYDSVTEAGDLLPRYLGVTRGELPGQFRRCLSNDRQLTKDGVLKMRSKVKSFSVRNRT